MGGFLTMFGNSDPAIQNDRVEDEDILAQFMKGGIFRKVPTPAFTEAYRESVSPGRDFLANLFFGAASGLSGQKFESNRERAQKEFVLQHKLDTDRMQIEAANERAMLTASVAEERNQALAEANQRRLDLQEMRDADKVIDSLNNLELKREMQALTEEKWRQGGRELIQNRIANVKAQTKKTEADIDKLPIPLFETARQFAMDDLIGEGKLDPSKPLAPEVQVEVNNRSKLIAKELAAISQKPRTGAGRRPPHQRDAQDLWGNNILTLTDVDTNEVRRIDTDNQEAVVGSRRQASEEEQKQFRGDMETADAGRELTAFAAQNPGATSKKFIVPVGVLKFFDVLTGDQRTLHNMLMTQILTRVKAFTGAQATDREFERITSIGPRQMESPTGFIQSAAVQTIVLYALQLRKVLSGQPGAETLTSENVLEAVMDQIEKASKAGKLGNFTLPDRMTIWQTIATDKGRTLVVNKAGQVVGFR